MGKYAILLVSALIFSMITYSHALKNALFMSNTRTVQSYSQNQAHNIAQSAAMMAIKDLQSGNNSNFKDLVNNLTANGTPEYYPNENTFINWDDLNGSYKLQFDKIFQDGRELLRVSSIGNFQETVYTVNLGLSKNWDPPLDQALHAETLIDLSTGSSDFINGQVSINSMNSNSVKLGNQNKTKINGDLLIAPGTDGDNILTGNHSNVSGTIGNLNRLYEYDMPIFPNEDAEQEKHRWPATGAPFIYQGENQLNPEDYDGRYINSLSLQGNSDLVINTGDQDRILHVGELDIQSSNITILGDGKLTVYVENFLDLKGNAKINEAGDVNQLMLFYRGNEEVDLYDETLEFGGNTQFNGSLFAEKAKIRLNGTAGIQGNIITLGNEVIISGNPSLESEIARVIFAPNATVKAQGNVTINGAVIANEFHGSGNTTLNYQKLDVDLPDLQGDLKITYWN